jgi:hypothetical protein
MTTVRPKMTLDYRLGDPNLCFCFPLSYTVSPAFGVCGTGVQSQGFALASKRSTLEPHLPGF